MRWIPDQAIDRLRATTEEPELDATRYRLGEELGRGGMGIVWSATDLELDREVAIKVLPLEGISEVAAERMLREARTLAKLEHPGIVPVHESGLLPDGRVFYAMKLVRGERLDAHLRARPELPLADRLRLFQRIAEPVAFAHSRGIVHRDLKPSNVMVGSFGEVLVMDWGIARPITEHPGSEVTLEGEVAGTAGYMAPEQARGERDLDARADVHALGAILRELCGDITPVPRRLRAIIARATSRDRAGRYPDAAALIADISRHLDGRAVEAYRENVFERAGRFLGHHRTVVSLVAAYLIMRMLLFLILGR